MSTRPALPLLALAAVACGGDDRGAHDAAAAGPLPRPECVVAAVSIRDVAEVARALKTFAGPALPEAAARADARLWMSALADLPSGTAAALADRGDAHLLVVEGAPGPIAWALPLAARREPAPLPTGDGRRARRAGRHLVLAPDAATLEVVAPFVERTLGRGTVDHAVTATVDAAAAPRAADALLGLVESIAAELRDEARAVRVQMGRAPEIGEPEAVAAWVEDLGRRVALAAGDAAMQVTLDLPARALTLRLALDARPGTVLARDLSASAPGTLPIAEHVPGDAALAVIVRRSPTERRAASTRTVDLLRRLAGSRLATGEAEALGMVLDRWDDATGAQGAAALLPEGRSATLLLAGDAERPDEAAAAAHALAERIGRGHLALVGERLGLWDAAAPGRGPAPLPVEVAVAPDRVAIAVGPAATETLARQGTSLAERREVADLVRAGSEQLVALGAASPTALVAMLAPFGGERLSRVAAAARTTSSSERAAWSVTVDGRRLVLDLRIPPPELRALAAALRTAQ